VKVERKRHGLRQRRLRRAREPHQRLEDGLGGRREEGEVVGGAVVEAEGEGEVRVPSGRVDGAAHLAQLQEREVLRDRELGAALGGEARLAQRGEAELPHDEHALLELAVLALQRPPHEVVRVLRRAAFRAEQRQRERALALRHRGRGEALLAAELHLLT